MIESNDAKLDAEDLDELERVIREARARKGMKP
jgi:hypothetical protein